MDKNIFEPEEDLNEELEENEEEEIELDEEEIDFKNDTINYGGNKRIFEDDPDVFYPNFLFAGFGIRAIAFIIDGLVIYALSKIILNPVEHFLNIRDNGMFFSLYNLIFLGIYLGYFFFMTKITNGQTLGKIIMGLRVVSLHEEKLSWETVFTREFLGRFILKRLKFLYLISIFSMEKQQLADILANTSVVRESYLIEYKEIEEMKRQAEGL